MLDFIEILAISLSEKEIHLEDFGREVIWLDLNS